MAEDVVLVGGDGVDENFPAVLEPRRALEEEGYSVDVIELYEGFEQAVEEDGSVPEIESSIEDETRLVGYCAGGVLAYQYIDHPDVLSFTGYDVPSGLRVEDRELRVDEPVDREDVFLIYAGEIGGRLEGSFAGSEVKDTGHGFDGREQELARAVLHGLEHHSGIGLEDLSERALEEEVSIFRGLRR